MLPHLLISSILSVWAPPPDLTVSTWADSYRQLSPEASAEPGRWRTSRAPYQRGIMDAVNDPDVETVVFMKSSQVGATEMVNNVVGYYIDQDPSPILVLQPTIEMARTWSKDRFSTMIRDTDNLKERIRPPRSKDSDNTILHKAFAGGHITVAGANSAASLASRPIRILLCDEVDRYPASAGSEGDPVELAVRRTTTFWNHIHFLVSTPTIKGMSRIEAAFEESNKQYYHVPCPNCGVKQRLFWKNIHWDRDTDGEHLHHSAWYECEYCKARMSDADRWAALHEGEWVAERPEITEVAGFHIWAAYSPWVKLADIVDAFLKSKKDPERLKVFVNTVLGETWEDAGETVDDDDLYHRREDYAEQVPADGLVITCGVDVQKDRLEAEVVAWGIDEESWNVDYFIIPGDLEKPEPWAALDEKLQGVYRHESEISLKISAIFVDSGYHADAVYKYVKGKEHRRIFASKGSSTVGRPLVSARPTKSNKGKVHLYMIGTDTGKESVYSRLKIDEPGPGYLHFPLERDNEYFKQLTAEKAITKYSHGYPKRVWVKMRERNEALDCRVLAFAAMRWLNPNFRKISNKFEKIAAEMKGVGADVDTKKSAPRKRRGGSNWMKGI